MIRLENVSKYYASGDNNVSLGLHNVSLEMKKGEIIGVVGESGSGKSTFLNVVSCLDSYEDGEIYYNDIALSSLTLEELGELRKNHVGFIFQNYNLIDSYTVLQNVLMPLLIKGITGKEAKEKAKEIIKKVGLEHRINHKGTKLSGGEKQRCVIARALASDSEILACDEPTGNLDSITGREIIELIRDVAKDKLVIIVTHNYDELSDIITRRLTFADGNLIEDKKIKDADVVDDNLSETTNYKISFKEKLKLTSKDVLSTPRKSLLSLLIFFVISAMIAYLYTGLLTYNNSYSDKGLYENSMKDRYVIFRNGKDFDYELLKDYDFYKYAFIEDKIYSFSNEKMDTTEEFLVRFDSKSLENSLTKGRLPETDNEVILGLPEDSIVTCYNSTIDLYVFDDYYAEEYKVENYFKDKEFKVVGYYTIPDTTFTSYIISGNDYFNQKIIESYFYEQFFSSYLAKIFTKSFDIVIDDTILVNEIDCNLPIALKDKYNDIEELIELNGLGKNNDNVNLKNFDVKVEYSDIDYTLRLNSKTIFNLMIDNELSSDNYYLSIYETDQIKIDNMTSDIKGMGYGICNAKEAYIKEEISVATILNTILFAFYICGVIFAVVVVFLISYMVLARIYSVKNKDYTVFRTLGMSKKDMASLVKIETVMQSLTACFLVLLVVLISYIFRHPIIKGFHRIGVIGIIIYIVFMFLYSLFFAIKFNKKLFKFSVSKTFRGGMLGND